MKDIGIIECIRKGENEKPVKQLYKEYPKVKALIVKSGGSKEIAREIFHDSLLLLIEKLRNPEFELSSKLSTYLYGINRFLMMNELRKQKKYENNLEWSDTLIISEQDLGYDFEKENKLNMVERIIHQLTDRCKTIFNLFYFKKLSMEQIAEVLQYASTHSVKTQKYKCIERASLLASEMQNFSTL
jgi:RNA polymerase sigma factor (sigma-70 family)